MSVIRKKPFIDNVVEKLTLSQKQALISVMNSAGNNVEASLLNMPAKGITPVLFKLDEANLKTGILIYVDNAPVTLIAYHRFQDVLLFELHPESTSYNKVNEYCDINELRRLLTVGEEVTVGEIDSGDAPANKVLASDGEGGATWKDTLDTITPETVESGDAVQLFGFDAEGNLVKDDMPEGIVVDQSVIEDSENAVAGGAVYDFAYSKEDVNGLLETKANVDGNYPTMTVGVADQLSPYDEEAGDDQEEPFSFQATGTGNGSQPDFATGSIALMKEKRGNTVVVNQLARPLNVSYWVFSNATGSFNNGVASFTANSQYGQVTNSVNVINGHKYYLSCMIKTTGGNSVSLNLYWLSASAQASSSTDWQYISTIGTISGADQPTSILRVLDSRASDWDEIQAKDIICIDLTQWFNGDIPQDLLDHPENFFRYYQGSLAYNVGELVNANSRYLKAIDRNQWDEENLQGYYDASTGVFVSASGNLASKNPIKVIPNAQYKVYQGGTPQVGTLCFYDSADNFISTVYFGNDTIITAPSNAAYAQLSIGGYGTTYNNDVTVSIYYEDESGYDQYYPYELLTNNDTGTEVLRSAGSVADSKAPDGTITRKVGYVDLGTLSWTLQGSTYWRASFSGAKDHSGSETPNATCKYIAGSFNSNISQGNVGYVFYNDTYVYVSNGSTTTEPDGILNYELAEPTTEQGTPYSENIVIDDFGSMDFSGTSGVPQGNLIFYPVDYKAFIDTLYDYTDGTPSNIALKSDLPHLYQHELDIYDSTKLNAVHTMFYSSSSTAINTLSALQDCIDDNSKLPVSGCIVDSGSCKPCFAIFESTTEPSAKVRLFLTGSSGFEIIENVLLSDYFEGCADTVKQIL